MNKIIVIGNLGRDPEMKYTRGGQGVTSFSIGSTRKYTTGAGEQRSPFATSGIRIGTPALTTRGLTEDDMRRVGTYIDRVLKAKGDEAVISSVRDEVRGLCGRFPLPH